MSSERWRGFSSPPGPDDPGYWERKEPSITPAEARKSAFWYQSIAATEMWEHLQYLSDGHGDESPYFQEQGNLDDEERRAIAPLILTFVRFVQQTHPDVPTEQLGSGGTPNGMVGWRRGDTTRKD